MKFSIKNKLRKYAVILPNNEFGIRVKKEFNKFSSKNDLSSFRIVFYNTKSPDFYKVSKDISNYQERKLNLKIKSNHWKKKILNRQKKN